MNQELSGTPIVGEGAPSKKVKETRGTKERFRRNRKGLAIAAAGVAIVGWGAFYIGGERIRNVFEGMIAEKASAESRADSLYNVTVNTQQRLGEAQGIVSGLQDSMSRVATELRSTRSRVGALESSLANQEQYVERESEKAKKEALEYAFSLIPEGPKRFNYTKIKRGNIIIFQPSLRDTSLSAIPLTERVLDMTLNKNEELRLHEIELASYEVQRNHIEGYRGGALEIGISEVALSDQLAITIRDLKGKAIATYYTKRKPKE